MMKNNKTSTMGAKIPPSSKKNHLELASENGLTPSEYVREALYDMGIKLTKKRVNSDCAPSENSNQQSSSNSQKARVSKISYSNNFSSPEKILKVNQEVQELGKTVGGLIALGFILLKKKSK